MTVEGGMGKPNPLKLHGKSSTKFVRLRFYNLNVEYPPVC